MSKPKAYLGDGVYAEVDRGSRLILTTEGGHSIRNTIILEPEVLHVLLEYLRHGLIPRLISDAEHRP